MLACLIAATIALLELITSRYRNTYTFLWGRWQLYAYMAVYGAFGLLLVLSLDHLVAKKVVSFEGMVVDSPLIRATLVGISTKALMNITLFNIASGAGTVPIGVSTRWDTVEGVLETYLYAVARRTFVRSFPLQAL
jgi:hypothetical protein